MTCNHSSTLYGSLRHQIVMLMLHNRQTRLSQPHLSEYAELQPPRSRLVSMFNENTYYLRKLKQFSGKVISRQVSLRLSFYDVDPMPLLIAFIDGSLGLHGGLESILQEKKEATEYKYSLTSPQFGQWCCSLCCTTDCIRSPCACWI